MKKYTYKEVADIIGIAPSQVSSKANRNKFPEEFKTTIVNEQNREIKALTEEGLQLLKEEYQVTDKKINEENKNLLGNLELVKQGDFLGTKCDFYKDMNDNIYMTREQITDALQYKSVRAIEQMHFRHKERMDSQSVEITRFNNIRQNVVGCETLDNAQSAKVVSKQHHLESDINNIHQNNVGNNGIRQNVGRLKASDSNSLKVVTNDDHHEININTLLYSERGVYDICFYSTQPRAIEFKDWVMDRVTEIRKFGFTTQTNEDGTHNVQAMAEFLHGKEESAGKLAFIALAEWKIKATMELERQKDLISVQNEQLEQQKPKVKFAEQVASSKDSISVNEMAKLLHKNGVNIGRNRLLEWLRNKNLVMKISDGNRRWSNVPTQTAVNKGLLTIIEKTYTDTFGDPRISTTTFVTPKGQDYILKKFFVGRSVNE